MKNLNEGDKESINITFEDYDVDHQIVFVEKGKEDLSFSLVICEFQNWMDYFCNVPTEIERYKNKVGFVFNKKDITAIEMKVEIIQFINYYNLKKRR